MNCEQALRLIEAAVEDELEPEYTTEFRSHLQECAACRQELDRAREFVACLEGVPVPEPPGELADRIKADVRREAVRITRARWTGWIAGAGLPSLAAAFIYFFFPGGFPGFWSEVSMLASSWWRATLKFVSGSGEEGLVGNFKQSLPPGLADNWQLTLAVMVAALGVLAYVAVRYVRGSAERTSWDGRKS